jgi:F0F1-type ATP synthase assembly protein I
MVEPNYGWMRAAAQVWAIPVLILVSTLMGLGLGLWLDGKLGTEPWLAVVLTLVGLAAGLYESVKILIRVTRDEGD